MFNVMELVNCIEVKKEQAINLCDSRLCKSLYNGIVLIAGLVNVENGDQGIFKFPFGSHQSGTNHGVSCAVSLTPTINLLMCTCLLQLEPTETA